ncbi:MAG: hypothetical protein VXZ99_18395, partial [Pseudomonadota bacterium]|nr:hypothetical protein [Pseudomonadota bacterium]
MSTNKIALFLAIGSEKRLAIGGLRTILVFNRVNIGSPGMEMGKVGAWVSTNALNKEQLAELAHGV